MSKEKTASWEKFIKSKKFNDLAILKEINFKQTCLSENRLRGWESFTRKQHESSIN